MYVDESGDAGMVNSPTDFFVLSGLVVHESAWHRALDTLVSFRRRMRDTFGLRLREEVHASAFIGRPGGLQRMQRNNRLTILRMLLDELAAMEHLRLLNVVVDKRGKTATYDPLDRAWTALVQRFENTLLNDNFPLVGSVAEHGMVIPDLSTPTQIRNTVRRMRRYNPIPEPGAFGYRDSPIVRVVEDPVFRDTNGSFFLQAADVVAYFLYQMHAPNAYVRKKGARGYFERLSPVLTRVAAPRDGLGIVRL